MVNIKESAPESEGMHQLFGMGNTTNTIEQKFKQKCYELEKRIAEVEESNEISTIALSRTRMSMRRLKLEYFILLERLEKKLCFEYDPQMALEGVPQVTLPTFLDYTAALKANKPKKKEGRPSKKIPRDPNLPKRPTNAYIMFYEREKDRVKADMESLVPPKPLTELSKTLSDIWKSLDEREKEPYMKLYEEDRERYRREMLLYKNERKSDGDQAQDGSTGDQAEGDPHPEMSYMDADLDSYTEKDGEEIEDTNMSDAELSEGAEASLSTLENFSFLGGKENDRHLGSTQPATAEASTLQLENTDA